MAFLWLEKISDFVSKMDSLLYLPVEGEAPSPVCFRGASIPLADRQKGDNME